MRIRVEFRLTMPRVGSWNGRWGGENRCYSIVKSLLEADVIRLFGESDKRRWHHAWDDGWAADVRARVMEKGERAPKSDGFCGYDWMVDSILEHGTIEVPAPTM